MRIKTPAGWIVLEPGAQGPKGIPFDPQEITAAIVDVAAFAWSCPPTQDVGGDWDGGWGAGSRANCDLKDVIAYLQFAMEHAHNDKRLKRVFVRIISRGSLAIGDEVTPARCPMLTPLKAKAAALSTVLRPELDAYYDEQVKGSVLPSIRHVASERGAGAAPLNQGEHAPWLSPEVRPLVHAAVRAANSFGVGATEDSIMIYMLVIIAHFLNASFVEACRSAVWVDGAENDATLTEVAVKLRDRTGTKWMHEHKAVERTHKLAPGSLNTDLFRLGLLSKTPEQQHRTWGLIQKHLRVLRLKNLYALDAEIGDAGLRFALVNVLFESEFTYESMVASPSFDAAVISAEAAEKTDVVNENVIENSIVQDNYAVAASAIRAMVRDNVASIATHKVAMVGEVQLHLDRYIVARKLTHLYFKVERAPSWRRLVMDCRKYLDIV